MDNFKDMSVKINTVTKQLPKYSRTTEEFHFWTLGSKDERTFIRKVKKIFEELQDKRYSIMDPIEVFLQNVI
jgi:predicted RNA-binding protein with EMAP domain